MKPMHISPPYCSHISQLLGHALVQRVFHRDRRHDINIVALQHNIRGRETHAWGLQMTRSFLRSVCHLAFATSIFFVAATAANAACSPSGQVIPADQVSAFLKDPAILLANNPAGGAGLIAKVRDLVGSNPDTLQPILGLLKDASGEQKMGIGNGLSQAAGVCLPTDQTFATEIQPELAGTGDKEAALLREPFRADERKYVK
jgi:hypothetical protein